MSLHSYKLLIESIKHYTTRTIKNQISGVVAFVVNSKYNFKEKVTD